MVSDVWQIVIYSLHFYHIANTRTLTSESVLLRVLPCLWKGIVIISQPKNSLAIRRGSGKNSQFPQLYVCRPVLCLFAWATGTADRSFFITCRLHWHSCFRPSNFKASRRPWANPGKVFPFWSSACLFAQLHKLLSYKSYSHTVCM